MSSKIIVLLAVLLNPIYSSDAYRCERHKSNNVSIRYEKGLEGAAEEIRNGIPSLKERIQNRVGLKFDFPFEIVIFKGRDNFLKTARNDMIGAFAIPERNLIVLDLSRMRIHPLNIELIIMHEMTHLILHRHIRRKDLPKWFDEGVCEWVSGMSEIINPGKTDVLKRAVISGKLPAFSMISHSFPNDGNGFPLAYEQGRSMVEYIENEYGENAIPEIIFRLKEGMGFDGSIVEALRTGFGELERSWKEDMRVRYTWFGYVSGNLYWIIFVAGALITIYGFVVLRKRIKEYPDDDGEEENDLIYP